MAKYTFPKLVDEKQIIGSRFNKVVITGVCDNPPEKKKLFFNYVCDCGKEGRVRSDALKNIKSCGCENPQRYQGYENISKSYWNLIQRNAKKRGLEFDLNIEYVWKLYERQCRKCSLSGLPIGFNYSFGSKRKQQTASIDRIDSTKGYIEGNIQICHIDVNIMKRDFSNDYFIKLCGLVANRDEAKND